MNSSRWSEFQGTDWSGYDSEIEHSGESNDANNWDAIYPDWGRHDDVPISVKEIKLILERLGVIFGFQKDNVRNIFDYLMKMLDSRSSRSTPTLALKSVHGDYIGGRNANFKKWYFATEMDSEDSEEPPSPRSLSWQAYKKAEEGWYKSFHRLAARDYITQVGLYLLCWGEANNVRFMPECMCFIFKCCNDYYYSLQGSWECGQSGVIFLDHVITPIYEAIKGQRYFQDELGGLQFIDKDHKSVVGYDDMNQLFWYRHGLQRIMLKNKTKLLSIPREQRFLAFNDIWWEKSFFKTFKETRSWMHVFLNFSRVINIHLAIFWCYTVLNSSPIYTKNYQVLKDTKPEVAIKLSVLSLVAGIISFTNLTSLFVEIFTISRRWKGSLPLFKRFCGLTSLLLITTVPAVCFYYDYLSPSETSSVVLASAQFCVAIISVVYMIFAKPSTLFGTNMPGRSGLATQSFTSNFYHLQGTDLLASYGLWIGVFTSKCIESYFFLALSTRDPIRELSIMRSNCVGDRLLGSHICRIQPLIVLSIVLLLELILFFLDTYLWYVIWNTLFSVLRSFYIGASIWTPWRNIFSRLPKRIYSKLIITSKNRKAAHKAQVSKIWNSIIISMYREHFLSIEQVQKLLYQQVLDNETDLNLKEPTFFISQEDDSLKSGLFYTNSEAQRRITFFAQSLSTPMPDIREIKSMPAFTVFIPHYGEKIILSLREIIRVEGKYSHVTMLEYLKQLYPSEWRNFVRDSKMMTEELESAASDEELSKEEFSDIPFHSVGFKIAKPEYIMRTRIWASLRSQTLYRTVSGFMNYSRAIKLLQDIETSKDDEEFYDDRKLRSIHSMALRKFRMILSMQRYQHFSDEEKESTEYLLRAYPELQIAYIEEEYDFKSVSCTYYSCLIDGSCTVLANGDRKPKFRIKLSGNPLLGDGKSDNQNHAIIFTRGEYIQLVDANQDNYLEECLKIRNILAEFDEMNVTDPYEENTKNAFTDHPVAIIGTREYIFSENIGILGDIAAGKEQTFGTLYARTLAQVGGKLHYGHPDFLNSIFMNTRGGVSKAQRGLHLNEDIYAGMNALMRGGRIKHSEYMQCGKGRDLGFTSILNFITKIGAGMGEQIISREYYFLGTQLPLDRFLSFYYAHAGFHLNNVFIILSIQLFLLVGINLAALTKESVLCKYDRDIPFTDRREPVNCLNLIPVIRWLERCIFSIFVVFLISFVPLGVQELTERGVYKSLVRLSKHVLSMSSMFEIFVCKVYSHALITDLKVGGAQYISTGRGFATKREKFTDIFSRLGYVSLKTGVFNILLITFISIHLWSPAFVYFWITILGLVMSPFLYNPSQLQFDAFFMDYLNFLRWMFVGSKNKAFSWATLTRRERTQYTGIKKKRSHATALSTQERVRPSRRNLIASSLLPKLFVTAAITTTYLFLNAQSGLSNRYPTLAFQRIIIVALIPLAFNAIILVTSFVISAITGPIITLAFKDYGSFVAFFAHGFAVMMYIVSFEFLWYFQNFDVSQTIIGVALAILFQSCVIEMVTIMLSREFRNEAADHAWWSGDWIKAGFRWRILSQPLREGVCKFIEMEHFVADLFVGHVIFYLQIPILVIPLSNTWHTMMLFWMKPGDLLRQRVPSKRNHRKQNIKVIFSIVLFIVGLGMIMSLIMVPKILIEGEIVDIRSYVPLYIDQLKQPIHLDSRKKGLHKDLYYKRS